ncbi:hypothetical protein KY290_034579 [Solanum tuberosum]|uniref:Uncharacterized protein n=1 Tax=Solanum tuberosum TaxID=4113 RepID=A0ABQ7U3M0_SOLTU|nr:hypothetical protein KY290_034579 [Solanum tuberosum]
MFRASTLIHQKGTPSSFLTLTFKPQPEDGKTPISQPLRNHLHKPLFYLQLRPVHPLHQPMSWVEIALQGYAPIFSMDINGRIHHNTSELKTQLITEGMKLAMENFVNQMWLTNTMNPLSPAQVTPPPPPFFSTMQALWNLPHHLNVFPNKINMVQLPFFTPQDTINSNPLFFPWQPMPVIQGHPIIIPNPVPMDIPPPPPLGENEGNHDSSPIEFVHRNFKHSKLSPYDVPRRRGQKIHSQLPVAPKKCSFDLKPPLNTTLAKYAVVMTPTMYQSRFLNKENQGPYSPTMSGLLMNQPSSFIVWNTRGANSDKFKRNFKELIKSHSPCMVALLETRWKTILILKMSLVLMTIMRSLHKAGLGYCVVLDFQHGYVEPH